MESLENMGARAKSASYIMNSLGVSDKNRGLKAVSSALLAREAEIMEANARDVELAVASGIKRRNGGPASFESY